MTIKVKILGLFVVTGFIQVNKVVRKISSYGNSRLFMKYWLSPLRCGVLQGTEPSRSALFFNIVVNAVNNPSGSSSLCLYAEYTT